MGIQQRNACSARAIHTPEMSQRIRSGCRKKRAVLWIMAVSTPMVGRHVQLRPLRLGAMEERRFDRIKQLMRFGHQ
jgi:hypothetical protein